MRESKLTDEDLYEMESLAIEGKDRPVSIYPAALLDIVAEVRRLRSNQIMFDKARLADIERGDSPIVEQARREERESCAKIADMHVGFFAPCCCSGTAAEIAEAIRVRGEKK